MSPSKAAGRNRLAATVAVLLVVGVRLDGESKVMDSPLRCSIRPAPVRVRLPRQAIGYSPAARSLGWQKSLRRLWATALGSPG